MGTTFSISLPMQRISQNALDTISNNPAFGHYANPAMNRRMSHDLVRSSQKNPSQKNLYLKPTDPQESKTRDSTDNLPPLLHNGPGLTASLTVAGGGAFCRDVDLDITATAERSTELQTPISQPPSVAMIASSRSSCTSGDVSTNQTILDDAEKYHILVVDDSPLNRKMLSKLLKSKGHAIDVADNGQQGVDKVKQEADAGRNYDVILMDFVMPVMDGPTATRAIRAMRIRTPIFGLTGNLRTS